MESITKVFSDIVKPYIDKTGDPSGDPKTVSYADIVSIKDGAGVLAKNVSIKIEPVQAGSGTPSPDNIRAISGWSAVNVIKNGKNIINKVMLGYVDAANSKYAVDSNSQSVIFYAKAGKTYTISSSVTLTRSIIGKASSTTVVNNTPLTGVENLGDDVHTWTATWDGWTVWYALNSASETFANSAQVEIGNEATEYEPYTGNEYTIDLGGTIYGGTLDVTSGKLTVDRSYVEFDGSNDEAWTLDGSGSHFRLRCAGSPLPGVKAPASNNDIFNAISNKYEVTTANNTYTHGAEGFALTTDGVALYLYDASISDTISLSDWTTALASNPIQLVYELATPQLIQLTPTQIRMLAGVNTVYANTGDTQVEYFNASVGNLGEVIGDVQEEVDGAVGNQFENGCVNEFNCTASSTVSSSVTWTVNNGIITANGTASNSGNSILTLGTFTFKANKRYKVSGCPEGGARYKYLVYFSDGTNNYQDDGNGVEVMFTEDLTTTLFAVVYIGYTASNLTFKPMITTADMPNSDYAHYVPYAKSNQQLTKDTDYLVDNTEANGAVNMLPNLRETVVDSGITYTVNADGSVTCNGTATANNHLEPVKTDDNYYLPAGTYKLTGCPSGGTTNTYYQRLYNLNASAVQIGRDYGDGLVFSLTEDTRIGLQIQFISGTTASNLTFKPMISVASYSGDYVPYAKSNKELTEDVNTLVNAVGNLKVVRGTNIPKNSSVKVTTTENSKILIMTGRAVGDVYYGIFYSNLSVSATPAVSTILSGEAITATGTDIGEITVTNSGGYAANIDVLVIFGNVSIT